MSDLHDMSPHDTALTSDAPSRAHPPVKHEARNDPANDAPTLANDRTTILTLLDPRIEHTRDAWHDMRAAAHNLFLTARYHSIHALPAAVVNNSTNILGATHVMTEMMMLKASGAESKHPLNWRNPFKLVWEPLKNVFQGTYEFAKIQKTNPALNPSSGKFFKDRIDFIGDTELATIREMDRQETNQRNDFHRTNVLNFEKTDAYKTLVKAHVDPAISSKIAKDKRPLTLEEVEKIKGAIDTHAAPEWHAHEAQRMAQVDVLRAQYKDKLGFAEVAGHGEVALNKEAFTESLMREFEGMSKQARAKTVKKYEGDLKKISGGPNYSSMRLANPWQMRSTLAGLVVWGLSAVIPDKKESDEEVEKMAVLRSTNPLRYIGERFREAVWVPEWSSHKRQMIGLGIMTSGVCSLLGSWRNRKTLLTDAQAVVEFAELIGKKGLLEKGVTGSIDTLAKEAGNKIGKDILKTRRYDYEFNPSYFATSMLTFLGSLPLLFASDSERGFSGFGTLMTGRLLFLPSSIGKKVRDKEPGVGYYGAGMASFQAENWAQALAGGAQKKKDPKTGKYEVVDHDDEREMAKIKSEAIKQRRVYADAGTPDAKVTEVAGRELAMPQRLEAQQKSATA